ncbi:N-glycosylase/DNA lyase-like [Glandiceps talaboti]
MSSSRWRSIPCKISELRLDIVLACGQSFRWREVEPGLWRSVLRDKVWTLKQTDKELFYQVHNMQSELSEEPTTQMKTESKKLSQPDQQPAKMKKKRTCVDAIETTDERTLQDYFQLQVNLKDLYKKWSSSDNNFSKVAADFTGIRMLRQDPTENLFSFICSSNNNITRISGMVQRMCEKYGRKICELDGHQYYSFPSIQKLAGKSVEQELRNLSFGYRAKFINQTAKCILEKQDENWLESLRNVSYEEAHTELLKLPGVGAKVADCVCLMSLDKHSAIPVDTHVWQIARRDYLPKLTQTKSLTDKVYREIGDFFCNLYGDYAGWAHSVLFSADLRKFENLKTTKKNRKRPSTESVPNKKKIKQA